MHLQLLGQPRQQHQQQLNHEVEILPVLIVEVRARLHHRRNYQGLHNPEYKVDQQVLLLRQRQWRREEYLEWMYLHRQHRLLPLQTGKPRSNLV
jgi:hypothetical protein